MKSIIYLSFLVSLLFSITEDHYAYTNIFDEPQIIKFDITLNTNKCNNKAFIPIDLPQGAEGWIYSITTANKSETKNPKETLLPQVQKLADNKEPSTITDFINTQSSNKSFNLYIIEGKEHIESFNNCGYYKYIEKYIDTKSRSGYLEKKDNQETMYIGIENNKDLKSLRLKIEAVAVSKH